MYCPTFGREHELRVGSNANVNPSCCCVIGNTYERPSNTRNLHLLTGYQNVTVLNTQPSSFTLTTTTSTALRGFYLELMDYIHSARSNPGTRSVVGTNIRGV